MTLPLVLAVDSVVRVSAKKEDSQKFGILDLLPKEMDLVP